MKNISINLMRFIIITLKILFSVLFICTLVINKTFYNGVDKSTILLGLFYLIAIFVLYKIIKSKSIKLNKKIFYLILLGVITRIIWLINIKTAPYSDFEVLYSTAKNLANGNNIEFTGNNYIARFPHLSYMVVYMSIIIRLFGETLFVIKLLNIIFSIFTMYLIYKISIEVFNNNILALTSLGMASIFPPMVTYVGVIATENIAIPFYLLSIYIFVLVIKEKLSFNKLILCGFILGIGNLFRMVAIVVLIALIIYIILFTGNSIINKTKASIYLIISFFIILVFASSFLKTMNISEVNLWKGKEPAITNILKGTNIESWGRFTEEDASIVYEYNYDFDKIEKVSKEIIKGRLTNTPPLKLIIFYCGKFVGQWVQGDMSGVSWSEAGAENIKFIISKNAKIIFQLFYSFIIFGSFIGLFNKNRIYKENSIINLFYIILCGYGLLYLITEMQGRYAYIICWIFIILSLSGIERFIELKNKK